MHLGRTRLCRLCIHNTERRAQGAVRDAGLEFEVWDVENGRARGFGACSSCGWDCERDVTVISEPRARGRWRYGEKGRNALAIKGLNVSLIGSPFPTGALMKSYRSASG